MKDLFIAEKSKTLITRHQILLKHWFITTYMGDELVMSQKPLITYIMN